MKTNTVAMVVTGVAFVGGAICMQLASSLGQWANEDVWPSRINWVLIIVLAAGAGFNALIAYMSGKYVMWRDQNGSQQSPKEHK